MVDLSDGALLEGVSSSGKEERGFVILSEGSELEWPEIRRSSRKMSLRSLASRGRFAKSRPKSSLLRMAEMRKGGLRGRVLRQSGKKRLDGSEAKAKGMKGSGGRGSKVLVSIPENTEVRVGFLEGMGEEGNAGGCDEVLYGDVAAMSKDRSVGGLNAPIALGSPVRRAEEVCYKQVWQKELIPAGILNDCALDLVSYQPLQEMDFVVEQVASAGIEGDPGRDYMMVELNQLEGRGSELCHARASLGLESTVDRD